DQGSFNSPEIDSGKVFCENCRSYSTPQGILQFNITYRARVRVWNGYDLVSDWSVSNNWKTPNNAYPQVGFSWLPQNPILDVPVQFTDQTIFYDSGGGHVWSWLFGDNGASSQQNPQHTYTQSNIYSVTLTATDNQNQSCSITQPVNVEAPNPIWKEVNPGG
ncbi:MAG: PKD domain-containing protein, partial [Candidatus Yanofskybacteria bacterium]|nr:PKD domain-containing protein [Candidatus Yanofskybacteria bacterium]